MKHVCTREDPYDREKHKDCHPIVHPEARQVGEQEDGYPGGDIIIMVCPICKTRWRRELPQ